MTPKTLKIIGAAAGVLVLLGVIALFVSPKLEFMLGGALVNAGFRLQDPLEQFDLEEAHELTPEEIWQEMLERNELTAGVRSRFPRTPYHPLVAMVACMDNRIDAHELVGDTRNYYYIVRTAGSVMPSPEQDMLELAVMNGVKVVLLTSHTKCAAEAAAANPELRAKFSAMTDLVYEREASIKEFLERPLIKEKIAKGELLVKRARIDTDNERLVVHDLAEPPPGLELTRADGTHDHAH